MTEDQCEYSRWLRRKFLFVDFRIEGIRFQAPLVIDAFHDWVFPDGTHWAQFYRNGEDYLIRFPELADFDISVDGLAVRAWPVPGISDETVDHLYLNQVLPVVLSKQGKWVFHASAVETPSGAVAFLAESGRGKSTLAAGFAIAGYRFLTDDALLLERTGERYVVQPSNPSIRLWQDSQQALVGADAQLAPPVQYTPKARLLSGDALAFCPEKRPLQRMYFLGEGNARQVTFRQMSPSEAFMGLVKHSFLLDIEAQQTLSSHFNQLAEMVALPIYFYLDYPRAFDALPQVRQAIIEHANSESNVE